MRMDECKRTVKKCGKTWKKSIDLLDAIVLAKKIRKQLKRVILSTSVELGYTVRVIPKNELIGFDDDHIDKLQEWIGGQHIRQPIKDCGSKAGTCTDTSAKLLCETFISLRKADFLQQVGGLMPGSQNPAAVGNPPTASAQTSAWSIGSGRVLQHGNYGGDPFTTPGQSIMVNNDSAAPSYEGQLFQPTSGP